MSNRYTFTVACDDPGCYVCRRTAPSPEDWQAIVAGSSRCQDACTDEESRTAREELEDIVLAAVRNMREAQQ